MSTRSATAVAGLALVVAAAAVIAAATSDHITGKAATILLAAPTGLAYVASGLVARRRRPQNGTGVLMILVGFAWFFAGLPAANDDVVFTVGLALTGLFIGFLAHLLLAFPSGRLGSRFDRVLTAAMYALVAVVPLLILLFDEGELAETACESAACPENLLAAVPAQPVANALAGLYGIAVGALSLTVAVRLAVRRRRASPALRRSLNPILVTAGVLIVAFATQIAVGIFSTAAARVVNWVVLVAMLALPLAFLYGLLRPRLTASTRRLVAELSEKRDPAQVQEVLRAALRDPTLELGSRAETTDGYVDVHGRALRLPEDGDDRVATRIGEGVIVTDAAVQDQPEFDEVVDATRIALERGTSLRSLEASERRAGGLLEAIPDNVYRVAADGTILEAHPNKKSRVYPPGMIYPGVPATSVIGRHVDDVMPDVAAQVRGGVEAALATDSTVTVELTIETPIGTRELELRVAPSGPDETVGLVRDVTERKRHEREVRRLADEQAALRRVATLAAAVGDREQERVFQAVTEEVAQLFEAQAATAVRFGESGATVVGCSTSPGTTPIKIGTEVPLDSDTPLVRVYRTGEPGRIDDYEGVEGRLAERLRTIGWRAAVTAPIFVSGRLWGAISAARTTDEPFPEDAERRIMEFGEIVGIAIANAEARAQLAASRARIVQASYAERRRLERNLHDGAQQRLVSLALTLRLAQAKAAREPEAASELLQRASDDLALALEELRELARGIHPAILTDRGLTPALESLAARAPVPVELARLPDERLPEAVEAAAFYVVSESLTNVAKYASAQRAVVDVGRSDGLLVVEVSDDGVGGADPSRGSGLRGLADRIEALEGRLHVDSKPGAGTTVRAELPLE